MKKKDVLFVEQIPDEKRDFDAEIILWRRRRRRDVVTQWVLIICFVLGFVLVSIYNNQQQVNVADESKSKYTLYLALVVQAHEQKQAAYPAPEPLFESYVHGDKWYAKNGERE
jgi:hypothetical protein